MFRAILKWIYGILFFVTPLIILPITSELFEFNKILIIYLIASTVFFVWSVESIKAKKIIFNRSPIDISLALFFLVLTVSTIFSIDLHTSVFGYYGRFNGGLVSIIAYMFLYFAFVSHFTQSDVRFFLKISVVSSVFVMLWGIPGKFGHDLSCLLFTQQFNNSCWTDQFRPAERMFSTLGQPNWLGAYLAIHFFIGIYFFLKDRIRPILPALYIAATFICILFTRSRSAAAAVVVGMIFIGVYMLLLVRKNRKLGKQFLLLSFGLVVCVFIAKTGINQIDSILELKFFSKPSVTQVKKLETPKAIGTVTESFDIRKIVWKGAWDLTKRYPILGTGPETFAYSYYLVRPVEHNLTSEWDFLYNKAHNEYLNYAATTGFFGLIAYIVIILSVTTYFFCTFYKVGQTKSIDSPDFILGISLYGAYLSIAITNFFGFSTSTTQLFFYLIPAMLFSYESREKEFTFGLIQSAKQKFMIVLVSLMYIFFIVSTVLYFAADIMYADADIRIRERDYAKAAQTLTVALKLRYEHVYEDSLASVLAQLAYVAAYQKQPSLAKNLSGLSQYYTSHSLQASPRNPVYLKNKAKNLYFLYQVDFNTIFLKEGIKALTEAALLSPTDPKIPYSQALFYSLLEDEEQNAKDKGYYQDESIKSIDEAISLKSNYVDAYILKAQLLTKYNNMTLAKEVFTYILKNLDPQNTSALEGLKQL